MKELLAAERCGMRSCLDFVSRRRLSARPGLLRDDFQRRRLAGCGGLFRRDLLGHFGCVNAVEFSNHGGDWLVSGAY